MAHLVKKLRAFFSTSPFSNPLENIVAEIGNVYVHVVSGTGDLPSSLPKTWTLPSENPDLGQYVDDTSNLKTTILTNSVECVHPRWETLNSQLSVSFVICNRPSTASRLILYANENMWFYSVGDFAPNTVSISGVFNSYINGSFGSTYLDFSYVYSELTQLNSVTRGTSFGPLIGEIDENGLITNITATLSGRTGNNSVFPTVSMGRVSTAADITRTLTILNAVETEPETPVDPYSPGGHSGGGGGTGRFSRTGDTIGEHNVPTLSAVDAGFITLFAPTAGEMKALASYLWSDLFSIDTFKKIFANPMDAILGLSIVPVSVPTSGSAYVKVGNISTGVSMTKASTQYVKLSCGSLEVEEYWGAYLDYSPYTKCEIYLPYIGIHELSIDDVMGKTVKVVYYIDILSGACTAEIYSNSTCLYSFVGQCSASIPITGNDWTNVINGVMQIGASIGSMVASGGLTAPISGAGVASGLKSVASASTTVASSKPNVERSGSMSGAGGMLGQQTPYLIITWPRECIPENQNKYIGYPSLVTVNLGDIVGFNIIESVHLENIPAISAELDEIESLLMNGVIF